MSDEIKKVKALHACNAGGKPMVVDKVYRVPEDMPLKDARYLLATKKVEPVDGKESKKGVDSKSGLK